MATEIIKATPDCEIVSSRIVNASRELVYRAWTLAIFFVFVTLVSFGQTDNDLARIKTVSEAETFIRSNPNAGGKLFTLDSGIDTSEILLPLYNKKDGLIFHIDNYGYKILTTDSTLSYRVNYIYLDGSQLSKKQIDSLRQQIISKYKGGENFFDLVQQYNMDINITGDTRWFTDGIMAKEFENAVKRHKKGDIFTVDIPEQKWYHVVLKTFDDTYIKRVTILKIESNGQ